MNLIPLPLQGQESISDRFVTETMGRSRCLVRVLYHGTGYMWTRGRCRSGLGEDLLLCQWQWIPVILEVRQNWIYVLLFLEFNSVCVHK